MINAIIANIQVDANLIALLRILLTKNINSSPTYNLQAVCDALGISTSPSS